MSDLRSFNRSIDLFTENLTSKELVTVHKKIVLQVLAGVVNKTPVDTGYARGNWHVTINEQSDKLFDEVRDATTVMSEGLQILAALRPFSVVYVTNNVPYILALENGHSSQAPPNVMLAGTLEKVRQQFE